jgi:hypothetical protein
MSVDRRRIEREWIEARAEKAKLQSEVTRARRAAKTDPAAAASPDLIERYDQARRRCKALDREFFSLLALESGPRPSRSAA